MSGELFNRLRAEVTNGLTDRMNDDERAGLPRLGVADQQQLGRQLIASSLERLALERIQDGQAMLSVDEEEEIEQAVYDAVFGLGVLQRLLDDQEIENINANGCDVVWVRYADGRREAAPPIARTDEELIELIRTAAARFGPSERRFDLGSPRLNLQLPDGSRLFAVMAVTDRPTLSIRRHRYSAITLDDLVGLGTLSPTLARFLEAAVRARHNIIVCGGTGAGKTTLIRALASAIPTYERIVTIEDSLELALNRCPDRHGDVVAMEAREPNVEGEGEVTLAELVRWALRMSPDRVIVGECRGDEVLPMLNAMSQGNDGSMCTLHANSSKGAFGKLAAYAIQAKERLPLEATNLLVANALDFVVFIDQDPSTGRRVVSSVREVVDADGNLVITNEVFEPGPNGIGIPASRVRDETMRELVAAGMDPALLNLPGWVAA